MTYLLEGDEGQLPPLLAAGTYSITSDRSHAFGLGIYDSALGNTTIGFGITVTPVSAPVPLPASAVLLLGGLASAFGITRSKRRV
ncbi:VPLPA-CTERM sorting domain-containing protein [Rhodovulum sp. P5]|uniref:VPLPA-CTERM sorting domain-containing protein n=1 Tax=Rhodovulum sp. P5 TaxID=1564506 RepID=UPI00156109B7|nr:VPLPA-CTERM sorting domain-containing protein [Rhodovulum sp. P5]